ncbi:hypothetical protein AB0M20_13300, partial [Actinoplanes sp. NPDC051633]|uniref:hypothetical protein n=1 Tax=Actinoplanes sp. NPDC051633 TaxID=3155670 RepID=UPI00341556F1
MQQSAVTPAHSDDAGMRAYFELLASAAPLTPVDDAERAYRDLLASTRPLRSDGAAAAYLALLASDAPLTPADLLPRIATAGPHPRPRTGRRVAVGVRGRNTVLAAALMAGISVAGVGVAANAS